jgi:pseudaminic acid synthase
MRDIIIGDKKISENQPPFIVAEMSGNHNQSLDRALAIVEAAALSGAQALKIQTYTAETMTLDIGENEFMINDPQSPWHGNSLYQLYRQAHTPRDWHKPIFERCRQHGLLVFSTPFDPTAVDFLESLDVPCYKIASFENHDLPLIRIAASTGKPLIISTGMASIAELDETVKTIRQCGNNNIILLKCTSSYPASPDSTNIRTIPHMKALFDVQVGLSDHTPGIGAAVAATALGATVIEKHFTLKRADGGVDSQFSLEPDEMKLLVTETERAWQSLGNICYELSEKEKRSLHFRRSLYVIENVEKGETFSEKNIRAIRPGLGLPPKYFDVVMGKKANRRLTRGTPVSWEIIE